LTQFLFILFILSCVAVPILWGITVNWLFGRLQHGKPTSNEGQASEESTAEAEIDQEEPVIEYYI
jgi:hypothetical protein